MLKNHIEMIREGQPQVVLTWHKPDGDGGFIPIAMDFSNAVDAEMRQRIIDVCTRPINVREGGEMTRALTGSSKHFLNLPKLLMRLGFRVRIY